MAVSVEAKIDDALLTRLSTLVFSPAIPIGFPNVDFTPPTGRHLRAFIFRTPTEATAFRTEVIRGLMQISVFAPLNQGPKPADEIAGAIREHFKRGTWLTSEGATVRIDRPPYAGSPMREDAWWHVPVTIQWFCQVNEA